MKWCRILAAAALLVVLAACESWFRANEAHEEHRFPTGEIVTCDSWVEQGFQSRIGRTMECWIQLPGAFRKQKLTETWLSEGETQPDGPNMLAATKRLELQRSGDSATLLMDNALLFTRPDLRSSIPWSSWRISEDPFVDFFLRGVLAAQRPSTREAAAAAATPATPGKPSQLARAYRITSVELPSLRIVAELQSPPAAGLRLPAELVFLPRKLSPFFNLNIEQTLAADPGVELDPFPADVVFEVKVAETREGKTRIVRREIIDPSADYHTETQEYQLPHEGPGRLALSFKPGFRIGENFVYYSRGLGLPDPDLVETSLGEWQGTGAAGWGLSQKVWGSMYIRIIRRGEESTLEEVPAIKHPYDFSK